MADPANAAARWLPDARAGSPEALGQMLEACRGYLLFIAQSELDPALRPKGGASDLVQETLLDAFRGFDRFQGSTEAELLGWLRQMLRHNVINFARHYRETGKRQLAREVALDADSSAGGPGARLAADGPSPSGEAAASEQAEAMRRALDRLPEDYQRVIRLRYKQEQSFEEIGRQMNLTPNAARKLWVRAIKRLQQQSEGTL